MRCIGVLAGRWAIAAASRRRPLSDGPRPVRSRAPCGGVRSRGRATPPSSGRPATRSRSADSGYVRGPGGHAAGQPRCRVHRRALTLRWPRQNEQGDVNGARWHGTATICKCEKPRRTSRDGRISRLGTPMRGRRATCAIRRRALRSLAARAPHRRDEYRAHPSADAHDEAERAGAEERHFRRCGHGQLLNAVARLLRLCCAFPLTAAPSRAQDRPSLQAKGGVLRQGRTSRSTTWTAGRRA